MRWRKSGRLGGGKEQGPTIIPIKNKVCGGSLVRRENNQRSSKPQERGEIVCSRKGKELRQSKGKTHERFFFEKKVLSGATWNREMQENFPTNGPITVPHVGEKVAMGGLRSK